MANKITDTKYYASIADAIRAKNGSSDTYYPADMAQAIEDIPSGGGGAVEEKDVNFYDYDGTLVDSYTSTEFLALSSMPANPTHTGLTAQGWNWSLSDAQTFVRDNGALDVGQHYITDDEKTRIYVTLQEGTLSPALCMSLRGTATVDWGDGTTETLQGSTSQYFQDLTVPHTYASNGDYIITIYNVTDQGFLGAASTSTSLTSGCFVDSTKGMNTNAAMLYMSTITKIELGENMACGHYMLRYAFNITTIAIPTTGLKIGPQNMVEDCKNLKCIVMPNGVINTVQRFCMNSGIRNIILPKTLTSIANMAFYGCNRLEDIVLPPNITTMGGEEFYNCTSLRKIIIPSTTPVNSSGNTFYGCNNLQTIKIPTAWTTIPNYCFHVCANLTDIHLPEGITSIGMKALYNLYRIVKFTIPSTVTQIGLNGISAPNIKEFHLLPTTPPTLSSTSSLYVPTGCVIYVPAGSLEAYQTATNWSTFASQMQEE